PARIGVTYPIDTKTLTRLTKGLALFRFIGDFAVQAFNKSYQMDRNENIQSTQFVKSYYHKLPSSYLFRMTIEATEQGYAGSYEATVECEFNGGANAFLYLHEGMSVSTKRSKYETVKDGLSDPEVYYEVSRMVRRSNKLLIIHRVRPVTSSWLPYLLFNRGTLCSFLDKFVFFLVNHRIGVVTDSNLSSSNSTSSLLQIASMVAFKKTQACFNLLGATIAVVAVRFCHKAFDL
ncbi:hypothetical protein Tco_1447445, partial [Tanacetum coccineum]